ncbi:MAG: DUF3343 domain-containing protein [Acetivibrio ethanolgignens]
MNRYIVTFHSHFSAISFHRSMKKQGIAAQLMPIPRHLSSSCGTCVALTWEASREQELLKYDGVEGIYIQES